MSALDLAHPAWLAPALAALVLGAAGVALSWAFARRRARRLLGTARVVGGRRLARDLALVAAGAALAAALVGPRIGTRTELVPASGVDVVLLLDLSRSMDAADVPPSRLVRARALASALLDRLAPGDRAALAAFAGRGVALTPLTPDFEALGEMLPALDSELIGDGGSKLGAGIEAALSVFEAGSERPRVVVALGDGEDPTRGADVGAEAARRAGARVVAIALGTETGATVPDAGVPLRDTGGHVVVSRRDAARLAGWARATDGVVLAGDRWGEIDLGAALAAIRRDAGRAGGAPVPRRVAATRVAPFAALAFALLWLELAADALRRSARPTRLAPARGATAGVAVLGLALLAAAPEAEEPGPDAAAIALEARLRARPGDARLLVELARVRALAGRPDEAARALRAAALLARDPALAALAWYDAGVLALERRDLEAARDAFFDALALDAEDAEARFNLEWTLRALAAAPPSAGAGEGGEEPPAPATEGGVEDVEAEAPPPPAAAPVAPADTDRSRFAPELDALEVERWLEAVGDESGRGLRQAAGAGEAAVPAAGVPRW